MFTAALIPIAKIWKQLSISGWVHKEYVVYTYTVESFSAIKKGNLAICDNMGNKADSERQTLFDWLYVEVKLVYNLILVSCIPQNDLIFVHITK